MNAVNNQWRQSWLQKVIGHRTSKKKTEIPRSLWQDQPALPANWYAKLEAPCLNWTLQLPFVTVLCLINFCGLTYLGAEVWQHMRCLSNEHTKKKKKPNKLAMHTFKNFARHRTLVLSWFICNYKCRVSTTYEFSNIVDVCIPLPLIYVQPFYGFIRNRSTQKRVALEK